MALACVQQRSDRFHKKSCLLHITGCAPINKYMANGRDVIKRLGRLIANHNELNLPYLSRIDIDIGRRVQHSNDIDPAAQQ